MKNYLLLIVLIVAPFVTFGAKLYVTNTNDTGVGSLRDQISVANTGDTIFIDVTGTVMLASQLNIMQDFVIIGPGPIHFSLDGSNLTGLAAMISPGNTGTLHIDGIKFTNGVHHAIATGSGYSGLISVKNCLFEAINSTAINVDGGNVEFERCSFIDNVSPNEAGACLFSGNTAKFTNCTFFQNEASFDGGAIQASLGTMEIIHCTFYENGITMGGATNGKALYVNGGVVNIKNNLIIRNAGNGSANKTIDINAGTLNSLGGNVTTDPNGGEWTNDPTDITSASVVLGNGVTDGWGLKYFPYADNVTQGINIDQTPTGFPLYDQRRVWRVMDDGTGNEFADAGAVEYTPLTVTQAGGSSPGTLEDNFFSVYNGLTGKKAFVFEIPSAGPHYCPSGFVPFDLTSQETIINGFSQNGSRVPGPGPNTTTVTNAITPIVINNAQGLPMAGIKVTANNCVVAGVSIVDYFFGGSGINNDAFFTEIGGCHIGVTENGNSISANEVGIEVGEFGSTIIGSGHYCGQLYHSNRNVISGNTNAQIAISGGEEQDIKHNYIGLASDGISAPIGTPVFGDTGIAMRPYLSINNPNFVGGYDVTDYNVIGGNDYGITISTEGNFVLNNVIGGTLTGDAISSATENYEGIRLNGSGASNNLIGDVGAGNVIVGNYVGILFSNGANNNEVYGNNIGVSLYGDVALGNIYEGVSLQDAGTSGNKIGGPGKGNVVSNNDKGIWISSGATSNIILDNLVGLSGDGLETNMGNITLGIEVEGFGTDNNVIGSPGAGNIVCFNGGHGIRLRTNQFHTIIQGNIIGLKTDTLSIAGNSNNGIYIDGDASHNLIGGCSPGEGNFIGNNGGNGIQFDFSGADYDTIYGNKIGLDVDFGPAGNSGEGILVTGGAGFLTIGNSSTGCENEIAYNNSGVTMDSQATSVLISSNSIHDNLGLGIDIDADGTADYTAADGLTGNEATPIGTVLSCIQCGGNTNFTITPESSGTLTYEVFKTDGAGQEGDSLVYSWTGNVSLGLEENISMPFLLNLSTQLVMTATIGSSTSEFGPMFTVAASPVALSPSISSNSVCTMQVGRPTLFVAGATGTAVWFSDAGLTARIAAGSTLFPPNADLAAAGTYTYYAVDSVAGCYGAVGTPATLTVVPSPSRPISGPTAVCEGVLSENYSVTPVSGATYTWNFATESVGYSFNNGIYNTGSTSDQLTADFMTAFNSGVNDTLIVSIDSLGCLSSDTLFISMLNGIASYEGMYGIDPTTCGGVDGNVVATIGAGTFDYYYDGGTMATVTSNGSGDGFIGGFPQGIYTFDSVFNSSGCPYYLSDVITLTDPLPPSISGVTEVQPATCGGSGSLIIYLTPGSASGPYTVDIDGGSTIINSVMNNGDSLVITGLLDGQIITNPQVTDDATLCIDSFTFSATLADPLPPTANAGPDFTICEGVTAVLTGGPVGGGFTYSWDNGGGTAVNASVTPSFTTTYTLSVTETLTGCVGTSQADVNVNPLPIITGEADICVGSTLNLMPNTGGTWNASNPTDFTIDNTGLVSAIGFGSGDFSFTDANGCISTSTTITINPIPDEGNPFVTDATCAGGLDGGIMIAPVGSYNHSWTGPSSFTSTSQNISGLMAGSYTNTMTDIGTGCIGTYTGVVAEPSPITYSVVTTGVSCAGGIDGSITFTAGGGTSPYQYSTDNGASFQASATFTGLAAGNVLCVVQDANGCLANSVEPITEPTALVVSAGVTSNYNGSDVSCFGFSDGEITATPSGGTPGYTYQWYIGASPIAGETSAVLNNQSANSYTVEVTDLSGCVINDVITLTEPTSISLLPGSDQTVCEGSSVNFNASATGGTGTITYSWSPAGTLDDPNINNPVATPVVGTTVYSVTATDLNGCVQVGNLTTTVNPTPLISGSHADPLCFGGTDGSITLVGSGGQAPYQYSVNAGVAYTTSGTFSGLSNGSSVCRIQDANGCESADTTIVINNPTELLFTSILKEDTCSQGVGEITINATGGFPTYSFSIDNGGGYSGSNVFGGLTAGSYDLLVQDANGCVSSVSTETINDINGVQAFVFDYSPSVSCFGSSDGFVDISIGSNPFGGEFFSWTESASSFTASTEDVAALASGDYQVVVTDAGGCTDTVQVLITEPTAIVASFGSTHETCAGLSNGSLFVQNIIGGTGPYTTDWQTNPGGVSVGVADSLTNVAVNDYIGITSDVNGCTTNGLVDVQIGELYSPAIVITSIPDSCINNNSFDFVDNNNVPPSGAASFSWDFSNGTPISSTLQNPLNVTFSVVGQNEVTYEVISNNGCIYYDTLNVNITAAPIVDAGLDQRICFVDDLPLSGSVLNAGGVVWSSSGTGTFSPNNTTLNSTYIPSFSDAASGSVTLSITSTNNGSCQAEVASMELTIDPQMTFDRTVVDDTCSAGIGSIEMFNASGGYTPYEYSITTTSTSVGGTLVSNPLFSGLIEDTYYIYLHDANGCIVGQYADLGDTIGDFGASVSANQTICPGEEVIIQGFGGVSYNWVNGGFTDASLADQSFIADTSGSFIVEISSGVCTVIDSIYIEVIDSCEVFGEITVNAFSPDGDGVNDTYLFDVPLLLQNDNQVRIFNRWGDEIRTFVNYNNADVSWDGTGAGGNLVTNGTYFYVIEIPELNIKESGWIQVVR